MLNVVALVGNLATEPELRYTTGGVAVCSFRLAVQRAFKSSEGQREADFFPVVTWRDTAEFCGKYLEKGRPVSVSGRLQVRSYEQDGQRRYITEVVAERVGFAGGRGQQADSQEEPPF